MIRILTAFFVISASICASSTSFSQVVFQDDFNAENGGVGTFNYAGLANWTISDGTVDLLGNGFFSFYPSNGLYVELDGTSGNAAILTSTPIAVSPGNYLLQFSLGNNAATDNSMTVTLGPDYSESFATTDAGLSPNMNLITRPIQVTVAGSVSLVFDHAGGDNFGLMIDDVSLTRVVPEPASFVLLSLSAIGLLARRP
jgi:hypothetical protein